MKINRWSSFASLLATEKLYLMGEISNAIALVVKAGTVALAGFLSNMATTAAGVAASALLFQGINSLVSSHPDSSFAGANPLSLPTADKEAPANNFLDAPTDSSSVPDSTAGFSELPDIGPDDASNWT